MSELSILLIEDDKNMARLVAGLLEEQLDASVHSARDCAGARRIIATDEFGLVLLDYSLPDGNGLQLLSEITAAENHPPVIILTGQGSEDIAVAAFKFGAFGYVTKSGNMMAMLVEEVKKAQTAIDLARASVELEISERTRKASEELYKSIVETSPSGITVTDLEGNIIVASPATLELHGYESEEEVLGKSAFDLIATRDHAIAARNIEATLKKGAVKNEECAMVRKDGSTFTALLSAGLIRDEEGNPEAFVAITEDITRRVDAENATRRMSRQLLNEQERARVKLVADLHDEVSQSLSAVKLGFSRIRQKDIENAEELEEMNALLERTIDVIRNICYELRPPELDSLGLEMALKNLVREFSDRDETETSFSCVDVSAVSDEVIIQIYRVAQEALKNVEKHAEATRVSVSLVARDGMMSLSIEDNGKGFDTTVKEKISFGLWEMRERIMMVDGEFSVESSIGEGTIIAALVPKDHG